MDVQLILAMIAGALIVEGLAYALAPSLVERMLEALAAMPLEARRLLGLLTALTGLVILWAAI
ncbi:hypothetical protein OCH239_08510 [Roseivivax halodurans JCM 10272]|uniref:DUF2065 domain-containing protein n=1 Tax=Roseivivax halodurans JCM 10272 TaxID=1449350 RepID=X7EJ94_9RHOB|nr:DUF2065 family protein [Roseivivax halodurans]ETX16189.1 hypothetical protein OCH239_08510 [Roseivivax halodurans JCM 10272]